MEQDLAIRLKDVSKTYKLFSNEKQRFRSMYNNKIQYQEKIAVNNVSFDIKKGETVALFGLNGAGKSTILKLITGVIYPNKGLVRVDGRVSAMLELTAGFAPQLTGRENIYFKGRLMGVPDAEIKEIENEIIDFAGIGKYIDQPVRMYSSGMLARLGFAINANIRPEIMIVDEALSVGDAVFREKCNAKIKEIVASGVTFLFVTHSTYVARTFCKRGMVLIDGRITFDGEIMDSVNNYRTYVFAKMAAMKEEAKKKEKESLILYGDDETDGLAEGVEMESDGGLF